MSAAVGSSGGGSSSSIHANPQHFSNTNRNQQQPPPPPPRWQVVLQRQVHTRNTRELAPCRTVFASYAHLHARVLALQDSDNKRTELEAKNGELTARVRELERAAAGYSVRTQRELELETRKDELQEKLHTYIEKENEYYRGRAELGPLKDRLAHAEARGAELEHTAHARTSELALIKKEYVSLKDENTLMRHKMAEADTHLLNGRTAAAQLVKLQAKARDLETEVDALRSALRHTGSRSNHHHQRGDDARTTNDGDGDGSGGGGGHGRLLSSQGRDGDEELLPLSGGGGSSSNSATTTSATHGQQQQLLPPSSSSTVSSPHLASSLRDGHFNSSGGGGGSGSATAALLGCPYPRKAQYVIEDAHSSAVLQSICFGESSRQVFTSGSDKMIKVWDCRAGSGVGGGTVSEAEKKRFSSGNSIALSLHCSSHYLLAGCVDKTARFWDTRSLRVLELVGHAEKIVSVCLSATAQHAFSASSDSTIKIWDVRRRAPLQTLMCQSTANDVTVSGDNIFSAHYNGSLVAWDRRTRGKSGEVVKAHQRIATCVRVSPDGRLCVSLGKDNTISVRDIRMFSAAAAAPPLRVLAPVDLVVSMNWSRLALSPDGRVVAVGSSKGQVICGVLDKNEEAAIAQTYPFFFFGNSNHNSSNNHHGGGGGSSGGIDDGIMNVLERGGHEGSSPVPCVAWGVENGSPVVSMGEDRRMVVWQ